MDKFSELEHAVISLVIDTQKLYADQTAEHSLEWTKCPAGRNFHQNATESFLETYREYKILNMRYRNVKPFQNLFGTIFFEHTEIYIAWLSTTSKVSNGPNAL